MTSMAAIYSEPEESNLYFYLGEGWGGGGGGGGGGGEARLFCSFLLHIVFFFFITVRVILDFYSLNLAK